MDERFDVAVVGAGLAGVLTALHLVVSRSVILIDEQQPGAGTSGLAAGLVNPFMGRRARGAWRWREAIEALDETMHVAGAENTFDRRGLIRPARDNEQAALFAETANRHPDAARWVPGAQARRTWPGIMAVAGVLHVSPGGCIDVPRLLSLATSAFVERGGIFRSDVRLDGVSERSNGVVLSVVDLAGGGPAQVLHAGNVVLAVGAAQLRLPVPDILLHLIKGEAVTVSWPGTDLPNISGEAYIVPAAAGLLLGSSYQHDFEHVYPEPDVTRDILTRATRLVPDLQHSKVLGAFAGVRATVPGTRLPVVGPLPGRRRTWVFNGLATKGLLMAPLLAQELQHYLDDPETIPDILRPRPAR